MASPSEMTATAAKPATVQSSLEQFDPLMSRLEGIAQRLGECADTVVGSRPSAIDGAEKSPSPNHLIYAIQSRRERLVRVVDHLESEVQRIANGLA